MSKKLSNKQRDALEEALGKLYEARLSIESVRDDGSIDEEDDSRLDEAYYLIDNAENEILSLL